MKIEYGLVGKVLSHSYSEEIHGLFGEYDYKKIPLDEAEFDGFFEKKNFLGVNVTVPYKKRAAELCDRLTETAKKIGAVNTVINRGGELIGDNTDYSGFLYAAKRAGIDFSGKKVLILGDGGTSLTARVAASDMGAKNIVIVSRRSSSVNYENVYEHSDSDIIVNTTPVGMYPDNTGRLVDLTRFERLSGVIDVVYNPLRTALILDAIREVKGGRKIKYTGGLPMLVAQAVYANGFFFGKEPRTDIIEKVISETTARKTDIVLIGMAGSGKSTLGRLIAEKLGREFADTDEIIKEKIGRTPAEIIEEYGEEKFREIESGVIEEVGKRSGIVISTGGGAPLVRENWYYLKQNGKIFLVERDISKLAREGRPLSNTGETLEKIYEKRKANYFDFADEIIDNNGDLNDSIASFACKEGRAFLKIKHKLPCGSLAKDFLKHIII